MSVPVEKSADLVKRILNGFSKRKSAELLWLILGGAGEWFEADHFRFKFSL
jgi:hypothetical protein